MTPRSSQRSKLKKGKSVNSLDYESITESMLNLNRSSLKVRSYGLSGQFTRRTFGRTGSVRDSSKVPTPNTSTRDRTYCIIQSEWQTNENLRIN